MRPKTLGAALAPVLVGSACAHAAGGFVAAAAVAAGLGALCLQTGTNFANDLFDARRGADGDDRLGPIRPLQRGWLSRAQMAFGTVVAFGMATLAGLWLISCAGPWVAILGCASLLAGLAYTAGPWPLAYHGLGDVFVMLFFGFVAVGGTAFVQLGYVPATAWWAAVPVGALCTAILVVNNLRDRRGDAHAGKRTLAVRLGTTFSRWQYGSLLSLSYLVPLTMALLPPRQSLWWLLPWLTAPAAAALAHRVSREEGTILNRRLAQTGQLLLSFSLLLALGIVLQGYQTDEQRWRLPFSIGM